MFQSIDDFLRYFRSVHKRALRDVGSLPPAADGWTPAGGEGENAWSINTVVGHIAGSRLYFASAYRREGWINPEPADVSTRDKWLPVLEQSYDDFVAAVGQTPPEFLTRQVDMIDTDGTLSGWRLLCMMLEHDIHHRSQLDTYAGLNGWPVPDIFQRSAETITGLQEAERAKHGRD